VKSALLYDFLRRMASPHAPGFFFFPNVGPPFLIPHLRLALYSYQHPPRPRPDQRLRI
jgi:hypothetical protein